MKAISLPFDTYIVEGEKLNRAYDEAIAWLNSIGLPYLKTRFRKYKKVIENFSSNLDQFPEFKARDEFHEFLNAQAEISEILRIYRLI